MHTIKDSILFVGEGNDLLGDSNSIRIFDSCLISLCTIYGAHSHAIKRIRLLYNGSLIGSCSKDFTVKIWNISNLSAMAIQTYTGHTDFVNDLTSLNDLTTMSVASASDDRTIQIWSITTGLKLNEIRTTTNGPRYYCLLLIQKFSLLASGDSWNQIRLYNINANFSLNKTLLGHTKLVTDLVLIDEDTLASSSLDTTIILWDLIGLVKITTLVGHLNWVNTLSLMSIGNLLVSGSYDTTIRVWDVKNQILLKNISAYSVYGVSAIAGSLNDEPYVFSGSPAPKDGLIKWNVLTGQKMIYSGVKSRIGALLLLESKSACK
jgi:WD40 repeat protein